MKIISGEAFITCLIPMYHHAKQMKLHDRFITERASFGENLSREVHQIQQV